MPLLNQFLAPENIILLWVVLLAIVAALVWAMPYVLREDKAGSHQALGISSANEDTKKVSYMANLREGFQFVSQSTYLRWLALATFLLMM